MIPSLSKISINVKYEDLHGLVRDSMDTVVNKDNFMIITELNRLKTLLESVDKIKEQVDAIAQRSTQTLSQSNFVTMMEEALSANDYELLKEYNILRQAVTEFNTFKEFLENKYGADKMAFLFDMFSNNAFELFEDYNKIVEQRKFEKLSLFLEAKNKDTGESKYIPLEYDHSTGLAGINLKKSMDFQRIYLGHPIVGFSDEAEHRQWGRMPDGIENPIGWEFMKEWMNAFGPIIYHIPSTSAAERVKLFDSIWHDGDYGYNGYMKLDGLWLSEDSEEEEEPPNETVYPEQSAAYYEGGVEELILADDSLVSEDVYPGIIQVQEDETLFNPVFWYDFDLIHEPVESEGRTDWYIRKIQNVGLAYYAIPSKLLSYAVHKLTNTQPSKRTRH